jgi:hypothetical protein
MHRWITAVREIARVPKCHGDDIVFFFAKGESGRKAATVFAVDCSFRGIRGILAAP